MTHAKENFSRYKEMKKLKSEHPFKVRGTI